MLVPGRRRTRFPRRSWTPSAIAVVDVETTGGSPDRGHRITEIAVVEISDGLISEDFQTLVNPGRKIPPRISELTGITDEMVRDAPFFEEVADDLYRLAGGPCLRGPQRVLSIGGSSAPSWGIPSGSFPRSPRLCTVQLARRLAPGVEAEEPRIRWPPISGSPSTPATGPMGMPWPRPGSS